MAGSTIHSIGSPVWEHSNGLHDNGLASADCVECARLGWLDEGFDLIDPEVRFIVAKRTSPAATEHSTHDDFVINCPYCCCEEVGHTYEAEDIADGVVGGGASHLWKVFCSRCGVEGEPDDLDD